AENRILEMYIHNLPAPLSPLIESYLRDARFLHVNLMGRGCKLDPTLDSTKVQREKHARVYILMIIGGLLMSDKSRNLVHLRWLLKLVDFREAGELSWGSVVLAKLNRKMCWATEPQKIKIDGCMLLLQSWVQCRLPFLCPREDYPYTLSLVTRVHGKLYMLGEEARGRQPHTRMPQQGPRYLMFDKAIKAGPSSTPM
ncbi:hypothetical protein J1N35_011741, partial [Gossypium stocksii]